MHGFFKKPARFSARSLMDQLAPFETNGQKSIVAEKTSAYDGFVIDSTLMDNKKANGPLFI